MSIASLYRFVQSFNRMNLKYAVRKKTGKRLIGDMASLIQSKFRGKSGIVYCLSRKECDMVRRLTPGYAIVGPICV